MSLNETPNANRLHIAVFGRRNSGKSSLINAITNQQTAIVSDVAGTTADPVYKAMELNPIGPCVFIDTAGFDDVGELGMMRVEKTKNVLDKTDIALMVFCDADMSLEKEWLEELKQRNIPVVAIVNKADVLNNAGKLSDKIKAEFKLQPIVVSASKNFNIDDVKNEIIRVLPADFESDSITGHLVQENDVVLLVMPQDIQAPKGRLILPQVQTIRDLLDHKCVVISTVADKIDEALASLSKPPELIITDSQVFGLVYGKKPKESKLTSFSVLLSKYKGDIDEFVKGAAAVDTLKETDSVLIAEACSHKPLDGDIARVKIPNMLRKKVGQGLKIDVVGGNDFPEDLSPYSLIVHCGGCMFNKKYLMSRIERAKTQGVPISNYGVVIAKLTGILDKIDY